jgi:hypothetical protein
MNVHAIRIDTRSADQISRMPFFTSYLSRHLAPPSGSCDAWLMVAWKHEVRSNELEGHRVVLGTLNAALPITLAPRESYL